MNALTRSALAGLVFFALVLALMLFVPAGTLHYWQGWTYWALFGGTCLAITLDLLKRDPELVRRRAKVGPVAETQWTQKLIQAAASVLYCATFIVAGFEYRRHGASVPAWVAIAANVFAVLGMYAVYRTMRENSYAASTITVEAEQRVIATGPYSKVRHPMYAGAMLMLLMTPPALGSLWAYTAVVPMCAVIVARLLAEEKYLAQALPGYAEYMKDVRFRLVPRVW